MSPRRSAAQAAQTRQSIVDEAVQRASVVGLESLSIGELATSLAMSKSGVVGPFSSRAHLLEVALDAAVDVFRDLVITPTLSHPPGPDRLVRLIDAWVDYLADPPFAGGCFISAASTELDGRVGPLREQLVTAVTAWRRHLVAELHAADPDWTAERAERVTTMLVGISMAANQEIQLLGDPVAADRARRAMRDAAGL